MTQQWCSLSPLGLVWIRAINSDKLLQLVDDLFASLTNNSINGYHVFYHPANSRFLLAGRIQTGPSSYTLHVGKEWFRVALQRQSSDQRAMLEAFPSHLMSRLLRRKATDGGKEIQQPS